MLAETLRWFTGGADYAYTTLLICMNGDRFWAWHLVASKALIFASYMFVAVYLWRRSYAIRKTRFAQALFLGGVVFLNCGGVHLLNGIGYFWPGRRLETLFSYNVALVNFAFAYHLYRIRALEKVLSLNTFVFKVKGSDDAERE